MFWHSRGRAPRLAALALCVVTLTGCPQLNWWSGPSGRDALFSVDPAPHAEVSFEPETAPAAPPEEEHAVAQSPGWRPAR